MSIHSVSYRLTWQNEHKSIIVNRISSDHSVVQWMMSNFIYVILNSCCFSILAFILNFLVKHTRTRMHLCAYTFQYTYTEIYYFFSYLYVNLLGNYRTRCKSWIVYGIFQRILSPISHSMAFRLLISIELKMHWDMLC